MKIKILKTITWMRRPSNSVITLEADNIIETDGILSFDDIEKMEESRYIQKLIEDKQLELSYGKKVITPIEANKDTVDKKGKKDKKSKRGK
jgi:hypothetical protein